MFEEHNEESHHYDSIKAMPLYQKAMDIFHLAFPLVDLMHEEIDGLNLTKIAVPDGMPYEIQSQEGLTSFLAEHMLNSIQEGVLCIPSKIAGTHEAPYDIKMENAAIIRQAAREIDLSCGALIQAANSGQRMYLQVIRNEIEEFRPLFAEWVKRFDPWDYHIDTWGLFNPPGVNYDDPNPDADIPLDDLE